MKTHLVCFTKIILMVLLSIMSLTSEYTNLSLPVAQAAEADVAQVISSRVDQTAKVAVQSNWAERAWGYCSRFVRQVHEKALPNQINVMRAQFFGASAMETAAKWRRMGRSRSLAQVQAMGGVKAGDVLFQEFGSGGYGHVGIAVRVNGQIMVAENTTRHGNRWDNRTITPLAKFGRITSVGRYGGFHR